MSTLSPGDLRVFCSCSSYSCSSGMGIPALVSRLLSRVLYWFGLFGDAGLTGDGVFHVRVRDISTELDASVRVLLYNPPLGPLPSSYMMPSTSTHTSV